MYAQIDIYFIQQTDSALKSFQKGLIYNPTLYWNSRLARWRFWLTDTEHYETSRNFCKPKKKEV